VPFVLKGTGTNPPQGQADNCVCTDCVTANAAELKRLLLRTTTAAAKPRTFTQGRKLKQPQPQASRHQSESKSAVRGRDQPTSRVKPKDGMPLGKQATQQSHGSSGRTIPMELASRVQVPRTPAPSRGGPYRPPVQGGHQTTSTARKNEGHKRRKVAAAAPPAAGSTKSPSARDIPEAIRSKTAFVRTPAGAVRPLKEMQASSKNPSTASTYS
jgi:hypothetical protein